MSDRRNFLGGVVLFIEVRKLTDAQKIAVLRAEAKRRHLSWSIFCTKFYSDDEEGYQGTAWRDNAARDDEQSDRWMKSSLKTPEDAAYALYLAIQDEPTHPARKSGEIKKRVPFVCPRKELSSAALERSSHE